MIDYLVSGVLGLLIVALMIVEMAAMFGVSL
jgi:hypothetical protein